MKRLGMLIIALKNILTSIWPQTFREFGVPHPGFLCKSLKETDESSLFLYLQYCLFHLCWSCKRFVLLFNTQSNLYSFSSSFSFRIYFFERLSLVMHILSKGYKKLLKISFIMCLFATFHPQFCCKSCSHVLVHVHGHLITVA